ncbi:splicing factor, suppressor of white-apricot homolog isoform X1 [Octopus sinensis]|uniref:Splicing factor, suppressor of white-apricot homolog isoform X1 n=2 Tax=Octopus sinensis TaxID=2607531 RepID=A0A6P7TM02_9MOLL|nr:splicing factor, suppressor of white-apricot homolog isoform X1 [Octopus sinensis]
MANPWLTTPEVTKTEEKSEHEELLVFGYACKLFPFDEKAAYIEEEKHLIPWMDDQTIMIDRYDGRGHLYDLAPYDASSCNSSCVMSDEEKHIEALCDKERYLELHTDMQEQALYEEEEWKRYYQSLSEGFNAVGFLYEQPTDSSVPEDEDQELNAALEAAVEKFVPPKELQVPPDIAIPESNKINAIIERTANFVVMQGGQMEIMLKTKQSSNPLFEFLNIDNSLCPYYKHVIKMIKSGKYKPIIENAPDDEDGGEDQHSYLHPLLSVKPGKAEARKPIKLPAVDMHNTAYGDLVRSVKAATARHQNAKKSKSKDAETSDQKPTVSPFLSEPIYPNNVPPPPGVEPVTLPPANQPEPPGTDASLVSGPSAETIDQAESTVYGENGSPKGHIIPPPPDVQPVIDKMALYVAKNGIEFEIVVKNKCDPRFEFLMEDHLHFPYYEFKKNLHMKEFEQEKSKSEEQKAFQNKGVSFSIKPKTKEQESVSFEKRPVFSYESSEEGSEVDELKPTQPSSPIVEMVENQLKKVEAKMVAEEKVERRESNHDSMSRKMAEEKLKDRLALAAREKLSQATKEKQLQAERKRKAALFINMLKSSNQLVTNPNNSDKDHSDTGGCVSLASSSGNTPVLHHKTVDLEEVYLSADGSHHIYDATNNVQDGGYLYDNSSNHSKGHQSCSDSPLSKKSPTPPGGYVTKRYNSSASSSQRRGSSQPQERSRSPGSRKSRKRSPSRKHSRSKSPGKQLKRSKSPSPHKHRNHSKCRSVSRSPSKYSSSSRQLRLMEQSPKHYSRHQSPVHHSRSHLSSAVSSQTRVEKSRSRSRSRSFKERSKSPYSRKSGKSPSRKQGYSKSPSKKSKSRLKSPSSKKKHKRSRSRSPSKKQQKLSRSENDKHSSKSSSKSKKDSKDKCSKRESSRKRATESREKDSPKIQPLLVDLTLKPETTFDLTSSRIEIRSNSPQPLQTSLEPTVNKSEQPVSESMLSKVRAMLKASRQAILKEDTSSDL